MTRLQKWAMWILTLLILAAFVPSAVMKLTHHPMAMEGFTKIGMSGTALTMIGIVELACVVLFLTPRTVVLGMLLLTGYLGGAVLANIIMKSDFIHALVVGLFVWIVALLRVPELRRLVPTR